MRVLVTFCCAFVLSPYGHAAEPVPKPDDDALDCLIEPLRVVQVGSRADGVLEAVLVDRGDTITRGQLLAELDSMPERAALDLARQRAREDVAVRSSQVKYEFGQRRAARFSDTYLAEAATDLERDEASTAARLARLGVDEARANRMIASLEVARVEALLQQRRITSPLNGVVVERLMNPGERVTDSPILTLAQIDPLKVEVIVPVALLGSMRVGSRAVVLPEAPVAGEYPATVTVVDRVVDARSGTFGVRLELANPNHALPGGLRCQVRFVADDTTPGTVPPAQAAEHAPGVTTDSAPAAPATQPAPRDLAPDDAPRLHSAQAQPLPASSPTVQATVNTPATTANSAVTPEPPSSTSSSFGNILLPAAAAFGVAVQEIDTSGTAATTIVNQQAAAIEDDIAEVVRIAPTSSFVITAASEETTALTIPEPPQAPVRDEAAERALLAALPPLPVLGGSPLLDTPPPAAAAVVTVAVAEESPQPKMTPDDTASSANPVMPASMDATTEDDDEEPMVAPASRGRAATASGRLRAEQAAGRAASLEPTRSDGVCYALGPMHDAVAAERVAERARNAGWIARSLSRKDGSTRKQVLTVALLGNDVNGTGDALQARGFTDLSYLSSGPFAGTWSAGVFSNLDFATQRREALAAAGFDTHLHPFGRAQKQHWLELRGTQPDDELATRLDSPASASTTACD